MVVCYDEGLLREKLGDRLHYYTELGSTNEEALELGLEGAKHGVVVLAERQVAGRGRRGADWFCGEGAGLAFSVVLRPDFERVLWPRFSLMAGLAVAQSIERLGLFPEIKWPNDVLLAGRKVSGILVEAAGDCVVVGVGLNVKAVELPAGLREVATSLQEAGGRETTREEQLLAILRRFDSLQNQLGLGFEGLVEQVQRSCALSGKEIEFWVGQERKRGVCEGIGNGGDLLVREGKSVLRYMTADEIRVVK